MKKFLSLFLCLISLFCFVGCTPEAAGVDPVSPGPWCYDGNPANAYEKMEYQIKKYDKTNANAVIAEGTLSIELAPVTTDTDDNPLSTLTTAFSLTFNDNAPAIDRGKTDTILSTVTLSSKSLVPTRSQKTVTLADRENTANQSYTLINDYVSGVSTLSMPGLNHNSTINFAGVNRLNVYDNDSIYHYLRAYPGMNNSVSGYVKITDFFDMHFRGSYSPIRIAFASGDSSSEITANIGATLGEKYLGDSTGNVNAFRLDFSIDSDNSGPPESLYFAKTPFVIKKATVDGEKDQTTSLVLVKIVETEYDYDTASVKYTTEYTLTNYTATI
ncbi:MAG: hypothetical protein IJY70_00465 [Clostridia bacterium]|nr:hypothetical protein [Clostridia bacterium]